jgi:hypothetical protein
MRNLDFPGSQLSGNIEEYSARIRMTHMLFELTRLSTLGPNRLLLNYSVVLQSHVSPIQRYGISIPYANGARIAASDEKARISPSDERTIIPPLSYCTNLPAMIPKSTAEGPTTRATARKLLKRIIRKSWSLGLS